MTVDDVASTKHRGRKLHPAPIRVMHWINALAMFVMIGSGWKIYDDDVIFGWLHIPEALTIGRWAQHGLQWHFFGMWMLVINGLAYVVSWTCIRALSADAGADPLERASR